MIERKKNKKLSFIHIPKAAGLSLHKSLEEIFAETRTIRIANERDREAFLKMQSEDLLNFDFISGHISAKELLVKGIDFPMVSVVRHPMERLISIQNYLTTSSHADHSSFDFTNDDDFHEYLSRQNQYNMQCWHLSGVQNSAQAIESIISNSIYVATLSNFEAALKDISMSLGAKLNKFHVNKTRYVKGKHFQLKRKFLRFIAEDIVLYDYVSANYDSIRNRFLSAERVKNAW